MNSRERSPRERGSVDRNPRDRSVRDRSRSPMDRSPRGRKVRDRSRSPVDRSPMDRSPRDRKVRDRSRSPVDRSPMDRSRSTGDRSPMDGSSRDRKARDGSRNPRDRSPRDRSRSPIDRKNGNLAAKRERHTSELSKSQSPSCDRKAGNKSWSQSRERSHSMENIKDIKPKMEPYSRSRSRSPSSAARRSSARRFRSRSRSRSGNFRPRNSRSRSRSFGRRSGSGSRRRDRSRGRSRSRSPMSNRRRHVGSRENPAPNRCLGVFGLSIYTTQQQMRHIFSKFGPVERVEVVVDAKTGRSRGFSFVYFKNHEDATAAKEQCSGMEIDGRRIRVDYSITKRAHTPTPGIYMGKPTHNGEGSYRRSRNNSEQYGGNPRGGYGRSPSSSPYPRRRRFERSRSRSYSPRRY